MYYLQEERGGISILGAKLFGIAAVLIAITSLLPIRPATTSVDFYTHDTYFVVGPRYSILGFALLWGAIAGFYYLGDRVSGNRLNTGLTLAHFAFWIFAVLISVWVEFAVVRAVLNGHDPNQPGLILAVRMAIPALLIGGALFLVNFAWALVRRIRAS